MSRSLRILARARADIDAIYDWLQRRSPRGAATWYNALFAAVGRIAENPDAYAVVSEAAPRWNRKIHQALFKTPRGRLYRIVFEWTDAEILILRIRGPGQPPLRRRDLPQE
jgi:plasmid stabilization system protein ParE